MNDVAVSRKMVRTWLTGVPLLQHRQTQWCALMGIQSLANLVKNVSSLSSTMASPNVEHFQWWTLQQETLTIHLGCSKSFSTTSMELQNKRFLWDTLHLENSSSGTDWKNIKLGKPRYPSEMDGCYMLLPILTNNCGWLCRILGQASSTWPIHAARCRGVRP